MSTLRITRRTVRLVHRQGNPPRLLSKSTGEVIAEGFEALALHQRLFALRIRGAK